MPLTNRGAPSDKPQLLGEGVALACRTTSLPWVLPDNSHVRSATPTGELIPASRCVVYQFSEAGFKFSAWKHDWSTTYTNGLGPGRMQGCKGFLPGGLQLEIYGQQCVGPEGWIFRIDAAKRIGVVETYTYD